MSLVVGLVNGIAVEARFRNINPADGISIGEYEVSLDAFCQMAAHFLNGGYFGWRNNETPEPVNSALSKLFEFYEQVDGKWVRKAKYRVST